METNSSKIQTRPTCLASMHYCCNYLEKPIRWVSNTFFNVGIRYIPEWCLINGTPVYTGGGYSLRHLMAVKYPEVFVDSGEYDLILPPDQFIEVCKKPTSPVPEKRMEVYNKFMGCCAYCGKELKTFLFQVDHIVPRQFFHEYISAGKVPAFLKHITEADFDHIDNLFPSCHVCNAQKGKKYMDQFRTSRFGERGGIFYFETLSQLQNV